MKQKKIYTSNYARNGNNPNAFGISYSSPQWFEGKRLSTLAPEWDMVDSIKKGSLTEEQYTQKYLLLLKQRKIDPQKLIDTLPDGAVLLCYESPGKFCHRRILAKWVEQYTGVTIPEWKNKKELEQEIHNQLVDSLLEF